MKMRWNETNLKSKPRLTDPSLITSLKLTPEEGFVLSLIDGRTSIEEICTLSTLPREKTLELIGNLVARNIIHIDDAEAPISKGNVHRKSSASFPSSGENRYEDKSNNSQQRIKVPSKVIEDIEKMYLFVQKHNYYDILGVSKKANREAIKSAYKILSRKYHPDQFYLKVPDDIRKKLDLIFATISEAYSTLVHPKLREEYDEQLATGIKKKRIAVDIQSSETSSPKEKGYRLVSLGDEAFRGKEYISALNNYKLALQLLGGLPSIEEKVKRTEFVVDVLKKLERIEKDELLLELDTVKDLVQGIKGNIEILPKDGDFLKRIATIVVKMTNSYQVAIELLMKAITVNPGDIQLYFLLSEAREKNGDLEGAIVEIEKVLKMEKKNSKAREKLKELKSRVKKGLF